MSQVKKRISDEEIDKIFEEYGIEKVPDEHWIYKEYSTSIFIQHKENK